MIPKSLVKTALWFDLAILFSLAYFLMINHGVKFSLGKRAASIWSGISVVGCIQDTVCHDMLFFLRTLYWQRHRVVPNSNHLALRLIEFFLGG